MRVLEDYELRLVGGNGADTYTFSLPAGMTFTSKLEDNKSTTITLRSEGFEFNWNSGQFIACSILSGGTAIMVSAFSGGSVPIGVLVDGAVKAGCTYAFSHTDEDGDEFV